MRRGCIMIETNKIHNMDVFDGLKLIDDKSVDLIITDPPYYIENLKKDLKDSTIRESRRNNIFFDEFDHFENLDAYKDFVIRFLAEYRRVLKPMGQIYMFFSYHHLDWGITMLKNNGFRFYKPLIWFKPDILGVFPNQYGCNYEVILWARTTEKKGGQWKNHIGCSQKDVFEINSTTISYRKECGFHPTPKPISLIRRFIENSSDPGDLILDGFMGSGTTAVASQQLNRKFIGFEINKEYIEISKKRLAQQNLNSLLTNL